jgi:tRNA G18 (ribose-2'-O)-methylase SpoU
MDKKTARKLLLQKQTEYNQNQKKLLEIAEENLRESRNIHSAFQHPKFTDELLKKIISKRTSHNRTFSVGLFNLKGDKNVGTIIRSGESFGASEFVLFGDPSFDVRSAVGCHNRNTIVYAMKDFNVEDIEANRISQFISYIKNNNKFPIFIEQGGVDIEDVKWQMFTESSDGGKQIMFIFGNEATGINSELYNHFPESPIVSISTCGLVRSLNVACCASIIFYDFYNKMKKFNM